MKICYRKVVTGVVGVVGMTILAFQGISYAGGPIGGATLNPQGDIDKAIKGKNKIPERLKNTKKPTFRKKNYIDPAVSNLIVNRHPDGTLRITAEVANLGNTDFMAGIGSARLIIQIHEMPLTTAQSYHNLTKRSFRSLAVGRRVRTTVRTDVMVQDFVEYGHRVPGEGEAQATFEVIAFLKLTKCNDQDGNPANDDINPENNRKTEEIQVMMKAPI